MSREGFSLAEHRLSGQGTDQQQCLARSRVWPDKILPKGMIHPHEHKELEHRAWPNRIRFCRHGHGCRCLPKTICDGLTIQMRINRKRSLQIQWRDTCANYRNSCLQQRHCL